MTIAIIGAGMAGLACAQALTSAGMAVKVFDKGRGPGGRMSTRRMESWQFDHGTQYLTARDPAFAAQVSAWEAAGVVQPWGGRFVELRNGVMRTLEETRVRYVGVPRMTSILRHVAQRLDVSFASQVKSLVPIEQGWRLMDLLGEEFGVFSTVLVAVPAPQAVELLGTVPELAKRAMTIDMAPCWSVMLAFAEPLAQPFDVAFVRDSALGLAARNNSKPGRPPAESWVLHATGEWSAQHLEEPGEQVSAALIDAFTEALGTAMPMSPVARIAHRWRFAAPLNHVGEACLYDPERRIGACGDWCLGARIEAAWLSGRALAARMQQAA